MKRLTFIILIVGCFSFLAEKVAMAGDAKPTLAELFEKAEFVGQFYFSLRLENKAIIDDSQGIVGFALNSTFFYSSNPESPKKYSESEYLYIWMQQPARTDPPGPDSRFRRSLSPNPGIEYILFIRGIEEFSNPVRVDDWNEFLNLGALRLENEEPLKWLREANVPLFYGFGSFPAATAQEYAIPDSPISTVESFEAMYKRNSKIRKRLYGTSDIAALRDAFAEVFASYPDMPSETILEEKGEDFSVAATRIHEALVEAFGKEGLRRLESGVLVPAEDEAAEEESE
ncbi:MAG: hypothetical protein JJT75_12230 [Opitutales bacterium]|nr:hypothetical protein [Opitutales bacterium]